MLQFDIRVTVRDSETREPLDNYSSNDVQQTMYELENMLDERVLALYHGEIVLLTISSIKEVK